MYRNLFFTQLANGLKGEKKDKNKQNGKQKLRPRKESHGNRKKGPVNEPDPRGKSTLHQHGCLTFSLPLFLSPFLPKTCSLDNGNHSTQILLRQPQPEERDQATPGNGLTLKSISQAVDSHNE